MHHCMDICRDIGEKFQHPNIIKEIVNDSITRGMFVSGSWNETAFMEGYPGIACFYAMMNEVDSQKKWKTLSHHYLNEAIRKAEADGFSDISLFSGITGLCFSVYLCSDQGNCYQALQRTLDTLLIDYVEREMIRLDHLERVSLHAYNLMSGITGVLAYALLRKADPVFLRLATSMTQWLVNFLNKEGELPSWRVDPDDLLAPEERLKYPEGVFFMNMPVGIVGCLSVLALAIKNGLYVDHLNITTAKLAHWIKAQECSSEYGVLFPNSIDIRESSRLSAFEINRDTWWSGVPCVARALYLSGIALQDLSLSSYAEKQFVSLFSKPMKEWNLVGPSFAHGRAGVLAITCRMAADTQNPFLWQQVKNLESDLKGFYRPHASFGFQSVYIDDFSKYHWVDDPGLFTGAIGIALSLLLTEHMDTLLWDRAFLLT